MQMLAMCQDAMARATKLLLDALRTKAGHAKDGQAPGVMTAFLNARDVQGQTALHLACRDGHTALALVLLSAGADPGVCDDGFNTAVSAAVRARSTLGKLHEIAETHCHVCCDRQEMGGTARSDCSHLIQRHCTVDDECGPCLPRGIILMVSPHCSLHARARTTLPKLF